MRGYLVSGVTAGLWLVGACWADPSVATVTHRQFQAVDASGEQTYTATQKVTLEGIVLHNPADMLDPTPDDTIIEAFNLGAQWQLFFQGDRADHAGTAVYLAQPFDVIGILDQESTDLRSGYRLYVMNYDGNGHVLASYEHRMADVRESDPNAM
jgi:hypothetical protein